MIELIAAVWGGVATFLDTHGIVAIAIVLFLEELGVPSPIPGDLLMLLAGVRVAQGHITLPAVLLIETVATFAGSSILYLLARRTGRPLVMRYGRFIGATPERLAVVEAKIAGREMAAVFLGRLVPGLRSLTVLTAGVMNVPPRRFFPAVFFGGFVYLAIYTVLGVIVGPPILRFMERIAFPASVLWSLGGLVAVVLAIRELHRLEPANLVFPSWLGTFLLGGLLSGMAGLFAANMLTGVIETIVRASANPPRIGLTRGLSELHFLLGWPVFLVVTVALGAAYRRFDLRSRPLLLRVLLTTALPLAASLTLSVGPLIDLDVPGGRLLTYWIVVSAAVVRWLVFGIALEFLPLSRRASRPAE